MSMSIAAGTTWRTLALATALAVIGVAGAGPGPARADTGAASVPSTLEQLLEVADRGNPALRAASDRWTAARDEVSPAGSLPNPRFTYGRFLTPIETRVGPQRQRLGLTQTIPLGKLGPRADRARRLADGAGARFEAARRDVRLRVVRQWNELWFLRRSIEITHENFLLVQHLESVALSQYTAGRAPHASLLRAQVELGRLEDRLRSLRDRRRPLSARLNAELGRPAHAELPWPESLGQGSWTDPDEMDLARLDLHPRLLALHHQAEAARAASRLAGRNRLPDLTLGVDWIQTDPSATPEMEDSGQDAVMVMATVDVPLWFGSDGAERAASRARTAATERDLQDLRLRLGSELEEALYDLRDAARRIELHDTSLLPRARQSLEVTEQAFVSGEVAFLDLIDAQRMLLEFELARERARTDQANASSRLDALLGAADAPTPDPEVTP